MRRTSRERTWPQIALLELVLGSAAVLALGAFVLAARPAESELSRTELAARGRVTYRVYCRSCHGTEGRGDGSLAPLLKVAVPDLTTLARQAGGELPEEQVTTFIDGREEVAAHGPREMPVWGDALGSADDEDGREEGAVQQKIRELVAHLASIQE
jgi:mono/diheme cytochrome c family protein